jgi:hypothetical protein
MNDSLADESVGASARRSSSFRRAWDVATRLVQLHRAKRVISALARPAVPRDPTAQRLALAALVVYFLIGRKIDAAGLFQQNNNFFNADCERVLNNSFHPNRYWTYTSFGSGHPLLGILVSSIVAGLELVFQGTGDLPARLLCHAAGAAAVAFGYLALTGFGVPRWFAACGAFVYAVSCSQLVHGSIIETFAFVALGLTSSLAFAARSENVVGNALLAVGTFGMNAAVAPHAVLMPPVLWLGRMRFLRWLRNVVLFLLVVAAVAVALAKLQDLVYPGVGFFFQRNTAAEYGGWWAVPNTRAAVIHRSLRLVPHFFAFNVVAPTPLYSDDASKMTTFMLESKGLIAHYDAFGATLAATWIGLSLVATVSNLRSLFRGDAALRARIVLLLGWLFGAFGLFMLFGDDLMLYSPLWTFHWIAWVAVGLAPIVTGSGQRERWARPCAFAFAAALALGNALFVTRMLARY